MKSNRYLTEQIIKEQIGLTHDDELLQKKFASLSKPQAISVCKYSCQQLAFFTCCMLGAATTRTLAGLKPENIDDKLQEKQHYFELIFESSHWLNDLVSLIAKNDKKANLYKVFYITEGLAKGLKDRVMFEVARLAICNGPDMSSLRDNNITLYVKYINKFSICPVFRNMVVGLNEIERRHIIYRCMFHKGEGILAHNLIQKTQDKIEYSPDLVDIYFLGSGTCFEICDCFHDQTEIHWILHPLFFTWDNIVALYNRGFAITDGLVENDLTPEIIGGKMLGWREESR